MAYTETLIQGILFKINKVAHFSDLVQKQTGQMAQRLAKDWNEYNIDFWSLKEYLLSLF